MRNYLLAILVLAGFSEKSWAQDPTRRVPAALTVSQALSLDHQATDSEIRKALEININYHRQLSLRRIPVTAPFRPVQDTADMAYVLMSALEDSSEVTFLRQTIAQNLPEGVKLVILAETGDEADVRSEYSQWIAADRLIIVSDRGTSTGFWARDSFPYPVYNSAKKDVALIGAKYYRQFSSGPAIAHGVGSAKYMPQNFTFVGGNLMPDEDGNCFSIDSYRLFSITKEDLANVYGCKKVNILKHVSGIGDADEVLKPLSGHRMLTNTIEYKAQFEALGYEVILLPSIPNSYRTYVNSLIIKNTVFMPSYGLSTDQTAAAVYEKLGYKVFMIPSQDLSDNMHGSVHCQSMAYPAMNESVLLNAISSSREMNQ